MKLRTLLILGAVGYAVYNALHPHWYEDLMNRAYAPDHLSKPEDAPGGVDGYTAAGAISAALGLPIGWILDIAKKVQPGDVPAIAQKVKDAILKMGPPVNTLPETLAAYKKQALAAAGIA
jgi:hypothetical protein